MTVLHAVVVQVTRGVPKKTRDGKKVVAYLSQDLIPLLTDKVSHIVKVHLPELTPAIELGAHFAPNLDDGTEHLVVAVTRK